MKPGSAKVCDHYTLTLDNSSPVLFEINIMNS